QVSPTTLPSQ
ncbi:hypothetical protein D020_3548B, partial [Vibrio parahaemolyticus SBR10290]